ncbi:MAG: hypothetical protein A2Y23_04760 [Clostridiales bacterium GWB2_37_7]|nr:MAG: hypothetical protein A2Y23_04760 [Clostridiales bacterium GWB2_37_7]
MKRKMILSWQIGAAYIGTIIGAGFASGQEIMQFFTRYGSIGMLLLILSGVLFSLCGYVIFYLSRHYKAYDYNSFIIKICGPRLSLVYDCVITMFLFFGASIMFSGSGAIFYESLGYSKIIGIILIACVTLLIVLKSIDGILKVNALVVPILISVILFVLFKTILASNTADFFKNAAAAYKGDNLKPIFSLIFYFSYNLVLAMGVLTAFPQHISSLKTLKRGAYIGGFGLMALSMALNISLLLYLPAILKLSIPVLYISGMYGVYIKYAVLLCIWCEICTTAISNVFSLAKRVTKNRPQLYKSVSLFIVVASIPMAFVDFKRLISFFYPLFGALSMFLIALILIKFMQVKLAGKSA